VRFLWTTRDISPQSKVSSDYVHGYPREEQHRLAEQTAVLAPNLFRGWDLCGCRSLLELGCGVGAELAHLRGLWPGLAPTGIDLSDGHLCAAREWLAERKGGVDIGLVRGNACALPFADGTFDAAITIWMLEHVADPRRLLGEALRVLSPHGRLVCTEVDNDTSAFAPEVPAIRDWWARFNRCQRRAGGDPWVGRRLAGLARSLGARDIATATLPIVSSQGATPIGDCTARALRTAQPLRVAPYGKRSGAGEKPGITTLLSSSGRHGCHPG
jgi:ubiquinone/menaquinone biosynthesis C-methylase UbiE